MTYYERKYISNKYPQASMETVAVISTIGDALRGNVSGVVFPKVPAELEIASDSRTLVVNGMKHNLGEPLVKVVDTSSYSLTFNSLDLLKGLSRRGFQQDGMDKPDDIKIIYVNGALIEKVVFTQVPIPQDIINKTKEYYDLGEKGNVSPDGLSNTDEERFNELDKELDAYYGATGTAGRHE